MNLASSDQLAQMLAAELPDQPRWIETRSMLRSGHAAVFGGPRVADGFAVRLLHGPFSVVAIVGRPPAAAILSALEGATPMTPILAQADAAADVERALIERAAAGVPSGWHRERVVVHRLTGAGEPTVASGPSVAVRLLAEADPLEQVLPGLRFEIGHAVGIVPVAAAFVDGVAASFCYPCWITESLWDVSVDTIPAYRRRGLAAQAARFMIAHQRREGREPVWGAVESNGASLRLAERLGFTPIDELYAFSRGPWAFLTNGYNG